MLVRALPFAIVILAAAQAQAAQAPSDVHDKAQVERYIRACEREWAAFPITRDPTPIDAFLAPDFQGVSGDNKVLTRAEALIPDSGPVTLSSDTFEYVNIRFPSADVAIAQGADAALLKSGERIRMIWTDVWMLRDGRWRLVASHDSRLPDA